MKDSGSMGAETDNSLSAKILLNCVHFLNECSTTGFEENLNIGLGGGSCEQSRDWREASQHDIFSKDYQLGPLLFDELTQYNIAWILAAQ